MITLKEVIKRADVLRSNAIEQQTKATWVYRLECEVHLAFGDEIPKNTWPLDMELRCPAPYDNIYELYLVAMIDYYHGESDTYANDMDMFNAAWNEARAYIRRTNRPKSEGGWKI